MTDDQLVERLFILAKKLSESANDYGYGSDRYLAVLDEITNLGDKFNRGRRQRSWFAIFSWIIIILCSAFILYFAMHEAIAPLEIVEFWRY